MVLLVALDHDYLSQWAEHDNLAKSTPEDLIYHAELQTRLLKGVQKAISKFPRYEQPKKLIICSEIWSTETGELTPSLKVRLKAVEKKYQTAIDRAYNEGTSSNEKGGPVVLSLEPIESVDVPVV